MSATDNLHPVQFRQDKTDSGPDENFDAEEKYDLSDYEYERLGNEEIDVDPRREKKELRIS